MPSKISKTPKPKAGKGARVPAQKKVNLGQKPSKQRRTTRAEKP